MDDVRAVLNEVGSERAALAGCSEGGAMCILFAATYPERTQSLITIGSFPRRQFAPDYPCGIDEEKTQKFFEMITTQWSGPLDINRRATTLATDARFRRWWAGFLRAGACFR